ncbi:MAG: cupin domain-containing protein [Gammaproteobacteria bacterium]
MDFDSLVAPLGKDSFFENYKKGACILIHGERNRFEGLISLEEIELRVNDGCNILSPLQIIGGGKRDALLDQNLPWSSQAMRKAEVLKLIQDRHSFMMTNMSQINPRVAHLVDSIEAAFSDEDMRADVHIYVSPRGAASGYNAHRDIPQHKLYLQVMGSTQWQVFEQISDIPGDVRAVPEAQEIKFLKLAREFELQPGDAFYMPPAVFHKVRNTEGPRVSLSIPFTPMTQADVPRMDRTYIPFRKIFESEE